MPDELKALLQRAGILRVATDEEECARRAALAAEQDRCGRGPAKHEYDTLLRALGLPLESPRDGSAPLLISLERYNHFFSRAAYVLAKRSDNGDDGWPMLRCTCHACRAAAQCEHIIVVRGMHLPGIVDPRIEPGMAAGRARSGRAAGSHTTARGKAAARKRPAAAERDGAPAPAASGLSASAGE